MNAAPLLAREQDPAPSKVLPAVPPLPHCFATQQFTSLECCEASEVRALHVAARRVAEALATAEQERDEAREDVTTWQRRALAATEECARLGAMQAFPVLELVDIDEGSPPVVECLTERELYVGQKFFCADPQRENQAWLAAWDAEWRALNCIALLKRARVGLQRHLDKHAPMRVPADVYGDSDIVLADIDQALSKFEAGR